MSENLLVAREEGVARLTLNRPERRNALDAALCRRLAEAIREAGEDASAGAILLDAAGEDFCSGMDLDEAAESNPDDLLPLHRDLFTIGSRLRKPMIAAVQGAALAGGLGLALNAHLVVASSDARFGLTEARVGLWPYLVFPAVAAAVGARRATQMAVTARIFSAREARLMGIVDEITHPAELRLYALRMALEASEASGEAIAQGLAFVRECMLDNVPETAARAGEFRKAAHASADFAEGVRAFREKRRPQWPSRAKRRGRAG